MIAIVLDDLNDGAKELFLFEGHFPSSLSRSFMLITDQVKNSVDHQKDDHRRLVQAKSLHLTPGRFHRNDQVSEEMGMQGGKFAFSHWKGKDIRRLVQIEVSSVQYSNLRVIDQQKTQLRLKKSQLSQYPLRYPS